MTRLNGYTDKTELAAALAKHNAGDRLYSDLPVMAKETEAPRHHSATGYGRRIPTRYMLWYNGSWRRVYCYIFSNIGSLYIGKFADRILVDIY